MRARWSVYLGGSSPNSKKVRFQIRKKWLPFMRPFGDMEWIGWVPGELCCCRFAPECCRDLFEEDLSRWRALRRNEDDALPSGDTPVKVLFEPRGRMTIPDQLGLAAGIEENMQVLVRPRLNCIEVWSPKKFTGHCARLAMSGASGPTTAIPIAPTIPTA